MKKANKGKPVESGKGSRKIFDFFSKKSSPKSIQKENKVVDSGTLVVESDEEFQHNSPINAKRSLCTDLAVSSDFQKGLKRRKIGVAAPTDTPLEFVPSTSECGIKSPLKSSCANLITIKSPEHLLSPEALKLHRTPEKQPAHFLTRMKTPTPKKLFFGSDKFCNHSLLSKIDEISKAHTASPKKSTPMKVEMSQAQVASPKKPTPIKINRNGEVTPSKLKKSKLFHKSPSDLNKFKVHVMDEFIKITPSKSNSKTCDDIIIVKSSEKKQKSILNYVSPSASKGSLEAQLFNESTPKKDVQKQVLRTPTVKAKTKLDFGDCDFSRNKDDNSSNSSMKTELDKFGDFEFDIELGDDFSIEQCKDETLDLGKSQHCKILKIDPYASSTVLMLESTKTGEVAKCILEGFWVHVKLSVGDTLHVLANKVGNSWIVNNDLGLLIYEPDLLVSATSVVGSLWCKRRSILQENFRGFEPNNKAMLIGTLVHSLLQSVLRNKIKEQQAIEKELIKLIQNPKLIRAMYECELSLNIIKEELMKFVPRIEDFVKFYIDNPSEIGSYGKFDWKGRIDAIEDIEENIWCPELGLKGKIDVTVKSNSVVMPLELKTGRASVSLEHRGQVMMYIMMMNKLGYDVPSGLLLYLREGVLKEIPITEKEKRDIMILRNELTYYLNKQPRIRTNNNEGKLFPPELPEPIDHRSCEKCPYNIICTSFAKYNGDDISKYKVLHNIQTESLSILTESHLNYLMKWISLIFLESNAQVGSKALREIYTQDPRQREANGRCIIDLKVVDVDDDCSGTYLHVFEKMNRQPGANLYANGIAESNYVVVSINTRPAVASGFVTNITANAITVCLDRNLNTKYSGKAFHLDTYESCSTLSYNLSSLALLMDLTSRSAELRNIIIDRKMPNFKSSLPRVICTKGKQILRRLNRVQQRTVLRALSAEDYFLIKGMPGTGKTTTIVALIQLLHELGKTIIITSHTHSAVDNVCMKLMKYHIEFLRLGSEAKMHPELKKFSEYNLTKDCTSPEELAEVYNKAQILAVTCLGASHPILTKRTIDVCILDESTQVLQCSMIRPLHAAKMFILIGDPDQLSSVVKSHDARNYGMSESLFERLYSTESCSVLNVTYRMNSMLTSLANEITYNGELVIGSDDIANAAIQLENKEVLKTVYKDMEWISLILDDSLEQAIQVLDTGPVWKLKKDLCALTDGNLKIQESLDEKSSNVFEAAIVTLLVKALQKMGVKLNQIGVIAVYRSQVTLISSLLKMDVDVSTVDQFQGKEKSVIILSSSKSRDISIPRVINKFEVMEEKKRLNVAITRAQHKLIFVGDVTSLMEYSSFQELITYLEKHIVRLTETNDFDWKRVFQSIAD